MSDNTTNKPKTKEIQRRNWLFTINNPEQSEAELCEYLESLAHVKYFVFGKERGDGTDGNPEGTIHYQGYIEFSQPKDWTTIKNYLSPPNVLPAAHFDPRGGTRKQAHDYVYKINDYAVKAHTRIGEIFEFGTFVDDGERSDLNDMMNDIESGMSNMELSRKYQGKYARVEKWANNFRQDTLKQKYGIENRTNIKVIYISGKRGTGKSRTPRDKYGNANVFKMKDYGSNGGKERFDGYDNQDVIIFEEFRSSIRIGDMLDYLDIYPCELPARYNNKWACYTVVYIISNWSLLKQYKNVQEDEPGDYEAFLSRINEVYDYDINRDKPIVTGSRLEGEKPITLAMLNKAYANQLIRVTGKDAEQLKLIFPD